MVMGKQQSLLFRQEQRNQQLKTGLQVHDVEDVDAVVEALDRLLLKSHQFGLFPAEVEPDVPAKLLSESGLVCLHIGDLFDKSLDV